MTWTLELATIGGALTSYGTPLDFFFLKRLNALGLFGAIITLEGKAAPTRGQVLRVTWDKGGAQERIHFEGILEDAARQAETDVYVLTGFDLLGILWQATNAAQAAAGKTVREFTASTPYTILTSAGTPKGLLYDSQGTQVMALGTGSPNAVIAVTQGTAMDFRMDSGRMLVNLQRLALQARYDGVSYGLEFYGKLGGVGGTTPQLHVVKRRIRAAGYTPESWNIPDILEEARKGPEGMTAAQAIRVVGGGDGRSRVESTLVGSGGLEGLVVDKTIIDATNATSQGNRLSELLDPTKDVVSGALFDHAHDSDVGDDVVITQIGEANYQPRLFEVYYRLQDRAFIVILGRPRPAAQDPLAGLTALAAGQGGAPQATDSKGGITTAAEEVSGLVQYFFAAGTALKNGGTFVVNISLAPTLTSKAHAYFIRLGLVSQNVHDGAVTVVVVGEDDFANLSVPIFRHTWHFMQAGKTYWAIQVWPYAIFGSGNQVTKLKITITNDNPDADFAVTAGANVSIDDLARHTIDLSHVHND